MNLIELSFHFMIFGIFQTLISLVKVNPKKYLKFWTNPIEKGEPYSSDQSWRYEILDHETFSPRE